MRVRPNLALFTFAAATALSACERRAPQTESQADKPRPIAPAAKGVDAPPELPAAAR
ncbi:hypothetical protein GCM10022253_12650 [Sphingomonas endophytica]|uniref:Argininosuccinate lyase n=1 Tax=Sphingomonas endophytica TaxID=869719 RepID=A0ABR6N709_9SPHN|nr:hypothetical protein [Sphingomonas endophytica]MBB5725965.1 hypothetical protein [Sphingomonas endophytica]